MAYSYIRHQEDALDVVQSAVCKALEAHESIKNEDAGQKEVYYEKGYEQDGDLEKELDSSRGA